MVKLKLVNNMNKNIINGIAKELSIGEWQVEVVLKLLSEGNTVPFIARYRKEATGALDEEVIRKINETYEYQVNLLKRKEDVIRLIDEKGLLTEELKTEILAATKLVAFSFAFILIPPNRISKAVYKITIPLFLFRIFKSVLNTVIFLPP